MRSPRTQRPRSISFRITAMIDMAFLLITFFIMSIRFGQQDDERIRLPKADQATEVTDERVELITLNVAEDGRYILNQQDISGAEFATYLRTRKDEGRKIELVVRGDRSSQFNAVQRVMRLSAEAGVTDVSLAAIQLAEEGVSP